MGDADVNPLPTPANDVGRKVMLITDDRMWIKPTGAVARLASTRLRLMVALEALNKSGHVAWLVANTTPGHILDSEQFAAADRILIGKVFTDYSSLVENARRAGKVVTLDVTDDLSRFKRLRDMRSLVEHVDAATVPSEGLEALVADWTGGKLPTHRVVDPIEGAINVPGGDLDRRPLRLVWYGSPSNARHLNPHMPGLIALADRLPLDLTIVSTGIHLFEGLLARYGPDAGRPMRIRFAEWTPTVQQHEIAASDLVILPGDLDADSSLKSANRLITGIAAGRFCVASRLPSYAPFSEHALLVDDIAEGIEAAVALPRKRAFAAVAAGQALALRDYSRDAVGRRWVDILTRTIMPAPGP